MLLPNEMSHTGSRPEIHRDTGTPGSIQTGIAAGSGFTNNPVATRGLGPVHGMVSGHQQGIQSEPGGIPDGDTNAQRRSGGLGMG